MRKCVYSIMECILVYYCNLEQISNRKGISNLIKWSLADQTIGQTNINVYKESELIDIEQYLVV